MCFYNGNFNIHIAILYLMKLATSTEYKRDMFSTNVEYFCEFWFLLYEKIMRFSPWKIGKYTRWASCWDQYSWVAAIPEDCHLCTEISKRRTIMQATVIRYMVFNKCSSFRIWVSKFEFKTDIGNPEFINVQSSQTNYSYHT